MNDDAEGDAEQRGGALVVEPARERAAGGRSRSSASSVEPREPAAVVCPSASTTSSPTAAASASSRSRPTAASEPRSGLRRRSPAAHDDDLVFRIVGSISTRIRPSRARSSRTRAEQRDRIAADADVAVEQQRGPPAPCAGHAIEDRRSQHVDAAGRARRRGRGGDVDAERERRRVRRARRRAGPDRSRCRAPGPSAWRARAARRRRPAANQRCAGRSSTRPSTVHSRGGAVDDASCRDAARARRVAAATARVRVSARGDRARVGERVDVAQAPRARDAQPERVGAGRVAGAGACGRHLDAVEQRPARGRAQADGPVAAVEGGPEHGVDARAGGAAPSASSSSAGVSCGVSIPTTSTGPSTCDDRGGEPSPRPPPDCGTTSHPVGSHGPGAPSSTSDPVGSRVLAVDRGERVGERRRRERGRLRRACTAGRAGS